MACLKLEQPESRHPDTLALLPSINTVPARSLGPRDGHLGDHGNFILAGELRCGDVAARAGTHIMLEWGDVFGPWEAGPHGCELYGFIAGEGQPFSGDTTAYEALLKARGPQTISLPMPKHLPPWMLAKLGGDFNSFVTHWSSSA